MKTIKARFMGLPCEIQYDGYITISEQTAFKLTDIPFKRGYERRIKNTDFWITPTIYFGQEKLYINGHENPMDFITDKRGQIK